MLRLQLGQSPTLRSIRADPTRRATLQSHVGQISGIAEAGDPIYLRDGQ
jgi:hypothetical protein